MDAKPAIDSQSGFTTSEPLENQWLETLQSAYLHPPTHKPGVRYTGRYDVTFDGETVVNGSRDPETDLARALLAKGITGTVKVMDANTGKHRTTVNIEKAAKLRTVETGTYPRFRRLETCAGSPPAGEDDLVLPTSPETMKRGLMVPVVMPAGLIPTMMPCNSAKLEMTALPGSGREVARCEAQGALASGTP